MLNASIFILLSVLLSGQFAQQPSKRPKTGLDIHSSMNIQFLVVDPHGRRSGFDSKSQHEYSEVSSSYYDIQSIGSPDTSDTTGIEAREFSMGYGTADTLVRGSYQVRVFCERSGPYWLDVLFYKKPIRQVFKVRGSLASRQERTYLFKYVNDPALPVAIDSTRAPASW